MTDTSSDVLPGNPSGYHNAFGEQNYSGEVGESTGQTVNDQYQTTPDGHFAGEYDLLNYATPHGNPEIPDDILIEDFARFYTALKEGWNKSAGSGYARTRTHYLQPVGNANQSPSQILRKNPGRRKALISLIGVAADPPILLSPKADELTGLAAKQVGAAFVNTSQQYAGEFIMISTGMVNPITWEAQGDLFAIAPFTSTGSYYVSVTEFFDS